MQNPVLYVFPMQSVLGRLSLSSQHHIIRRVIWVQSLKSQPRPALYPHPQLRRGLPRRARPSLRGRPNPRRPPPHPPQHAAAHRRPAPPSPSLAAPWNRTEREALAERYPGAFCDKAQSCRALATVAYRGISLISICLPNMVSRPAANVLL